MKFTCTAEINRSLPEVVELYSDTKHVEYWLKGFVSKEVITGNMGQPGSKAKITMNFRNKTMELIETVQSNHLPTQITALYEHKHMINTMSSRFEPVAADKTLLAVDVHYTKFIGVMPKLMSVLVPGMFRKQTQKMIDDFKAFAESGS